MTYDTWKTTNPDDEFLGPDPDQDDEPDYAGPYCQWPRCECAPWECQQRLDEIHEKHMDDLRSDEREP